MEDNEEELEKDEEFPYEDPEDFDAYPDSTQSKVST